MVSVLTRRGLYCPYSERTLSDGRRLSWKAVRPEHELTTPPGVAVDEAQLAEDERLGRVGVGITRIRTGQQLWASIARWRRGIPVNRGFGPQRALLWHQLDPLPGADGQLGLFDEVAR
jgi:hypothetical protein